MAGRYNYQTSWVQEASQQPEPNLPARPCADGNVIRWVRLETDVDPGGRDLPSQSPPTSKSLRNETRPHLGLMELTICKHWGFLV
jgi:hypothetical protein